MKNRAAAVTIENKSYGKDNPEYNQSSTHGSNGRVEVSSVEVDVISHALYIRRGQTFQHQGRSHKF